MTELNNIPYTKHVSEDALKKILNNPLVEDWVSEIRVTDTNKVFGMVLHNILRQWVLESSTQSINELKLFIPVINKIIIAYPEIFELDSNKYKQVYRGTNMTESKLREFIELTNISKWIKIQVGAKYFYIYWPKTFTYKPHREMQSWSVNKNRASEFGECILVADSDSSTFIMNPDFMDIMSKAEGNSNEYETIHIGKKLDVWLGVESEWFDDLTK